MTNAAEGTAQPRYRLCCLPKNRSNPAYVGAVVGATRLAESMGCQLIGLAPETPDDLEEQRTLIGAALELSPDAILIAPVDVTALNSDLQRILDLGIPLFYFVTSAVGVPATSFITSDNHALGLDIARRLFRHLGGTGKVVIIEGLDSSPTSPPRTQGFLEAAGEFPGISIVARTSGSYQHDEAKREMARLLARHERIDGVVAANDAMALGVIEALDEAGRTAAVVGMNAVPTAISAIKAGKLLATVSYDALSLLCIGVEAAVRFLDGQPVPQQIELPAEVVDIHNCEAWDRPYENRPLPEWDRVVGGE